MKLDELDYLALLPSWMREDESNKGLAAGLAALIITRTQLFKQCSFFDAVSELPDSLLDALAALLCIDWYRVGWSRTQKIDCLENSDLIRQKAGSKWALEKALRIWLNDPGATVQEWWEYGGPFYTFRVITDSPTAANLEGRESFLRLLAQVQRASQSIDGVFIGFSMRGEIHLGAKAGEGDGGQGWADYLPWVQGYGGGVASKSALVDYLEELNPDVSAAVIAEYVNDKYDEVNEEFTDDTPLSINSDKTPRFLTWADREAIGAAENIFPQVGFQDAVEIAYSWPQNRLRLGLQNFWTFYSTRFSTYTEAPYIGSGACSTSNMNNTMHGENYCALYPATNAGYCRVNNIQAVGNDTISAISFDMYFADDFPDPGDYACLGLVGRCIISAYNTARYVFIAVDSAGLLRLMYYYSGAYHTIAQSSTVFPQGVWVNVLFRCQNGICAVYVNGETFISVLAADSGLGAKQNLSYISMGNGLSGTLSQVGYNTYTPSNYWSRFGYWLNRGITGASFDGQCLAAKMPPWEFLPKP